MTDILHIVDWNGDVVMLTIFKVNAALVVVNMSTLDAANDGNFLKITISISVSHLVLHEFCMRNSHKKLT